MNDTEQAKEDAAVAAAYFLELREKKVILADAIALTQSYMLQRMISRKAVPPKEPWEQ